MKMFPFVVLLFAGCASTTPPPMVAPPQAVSTFTLKSYDGREIEGQLIAIEVPERRAIANSRRITVGAVRLPSRSATPGSPIIFLSGGPGIPATAIARVPPYFTLFESLRATADVILLDQRGGGGFSKPELSCAGGPPLATDAFTSDRALIEAVRAQIAACATSWRERGGDVAGYTTAESADDIESLRLALRVPKVSLLAFSYGSELALSYIARHGAQLDRVAFASTRAPGYLLKLPSTWDRQLDALGYSDDVRRAAQRLASNPVTLRIKRKSTNDEVDVVAGDIAFLTIVRGWLGDARSFSQIPKLVESLDRNDTEPLQKQVEALYNGMSNLSLMAMAIDCSSGWSSERLDRTRREASTAIMRNVNLQWSPEICSAAIGRTATPASLAGTARPALFITGTLDPNAPASQADEIRARFANSGHVRVSGGGHETLPNPDVQRIVVAFFAGEAPHDDILK
jgi:pimeloyl-ACP methyl ester carboxylesterase